MPRIITAIENPPTLPPLGLPWKGHRLPDIPESFPDVVRRIPENVPDLPARRRDNLDDGPVIGPRNTPGERRMPKGIMST